MQKELSSVKEKHGGNDAEVGSFKQSEIAKSDRKEVDYGDYVLKQMYTNVYIGYFQGYTFWLYVPNNIENMGNVPLVTYLHGLGEQGNDYTSGYDEAYYRGYIRQTVTQGYSYNAIIVQPQLHTNQKWNTVSNEKVLFNLIDALKKHYSINEKKISLSGFSNGCYGTKNIVKNHTNYFSCVVAIGCQYESDSKLLSAYQNTPFYAIGAGDGNSTMKTFVENLNAAGGKGYFKDYGGKHSEVVGDNESNLLRQQDLKLMEWILSQERK